ncbi:hypothetical protein ALP71_00557 [Pseudomonas coronafaciens pv. garcae]|nr:hypothetical protein ALP71_00557 [Pseudomonas coronafaciens pv. garcae]
MLFCDGILLCLPAVETFPLKARRNNMSETPPVSSGNSDAAIEKMSATFDMAIEKSAKITEISTAKKAELDATKQRPQN